MSHIMLPTGLFAVRSKMYVAAMHGDVESVEKHLGTLKLVINPLATTNAINGYDEFGNTVLHVAAANGHPNVVKYLLHHKALVDIVMDSKAPGSEQRTPLHCASLGGHARVCKILLSFMADPHNEDTTGKKPFHIAITPGTREVLLLAMQSSTNLVIANDLLKKAESATLMHTSPLVLMEAPDNYLKLKMSYDAWTRDVLKTQKSGIGVPVHKMPTPPFIRHCENKPHFGTFLVLRHARDKSGKEPFSGLCKTTGCMYTEEQAFIIHDIWIRPDRREQQFGSVLMLALLSMHAQEQFIHCIANVHRNNKTAQNFFMRMGFKKLEPDGIEAGLRKSKHDFFEMRNIGIGIMRVEGMLRLFESVKIIADDDIMEEEAERVKQALERRREEQARKKRDLKTEEGMERARLEKQMAGTLDVDESRFWMMPRPLPSKDGSLLKLPGEFFNPDLSKLHEPWISPASNTIKKKKVIRRGSMAQPEQEEKGEKDDDDDDDERKALPGAVEVTGSSRPATELDRVPDYILKVYEPAVARTRDEAVSQRRTTVLREGRHSLILRDFDDERRANFMADFEEYEDGRSKTKGADRNLFSSPVKLKIESAAARGEYSGARRHGQSTLGGFADEFAKPSPGKLRGRKYLDDDDD
mmetsp:Transcript_24702/g.58783  ORF Transcript_24702/g.58783 Transcript_24702/m.58783 type:complete len:640 (+) Transcript_24702:389-2308(+)